MPKMWPAGGAGKKAPTSRLITLPHHLPVRRRLWSWCSQGKSRLPLEGGPAGPGSGAAWHERCSPRLTPAWALRPQEKLVLLVVSEEGGTPRFRPRPSPRRALQDQPTNQPTKLPVFSERLFSFTAAKWRTFVCFLLQNEKGFLKRKYLNCQAEH